jgi:hypothetical protein
MEKAKKIARYIVLNYWLVIFTLIIILIAQVAR